MKQNQNIHCAPTFFRRSCSALFCALFGAAVAPLPASAQVNVLTYHNDMARTGQNISETNLTVANVNTNTFGLLFFCPVDGQIYAQPLYMAAVAITNKGTHNVVFAATENDSVFAFDADSNSGSNAAPLWQVGFINPAAGVTPVPSGDVGLSSNNPPFGITGTPVIDPTTMTLYVVARTKEVSGTATNYIHRLHALDVGSGAEKFGGPVVIHPVVAGTGQANDGAGHVPFDGLREQNRAGLLLANGVVYVAFASANDVQPFHGWLLGFNAQTLQPQGVFNSTPNGGLGGFWEGGDGPAADTDGNIYIVSGNGTFDGATNNDYGDSYLKFTPDGTNLVLTDYFTPFNQQYLFTNDLDAGGGGLVVLPDEVGSAAHPHLAAGVGKDGIIHLVDRDAFGGYNATNNDQIVESVAAFNLVDSTPAYFDSTLYYVTKSKTPTAFSFSEGVLQTNPVSSNSTVFPKGATPSISANGTSNGILWALQYAYPNPPGVLYAFNATNLGLELYNSQQAGLRDSPAAWANFTVPTVANGKVYVGGAALSVFGLAAWNATPGISPDGGIFTNSVTVTLTSNAPTGQIYYTLDGTTPTTNSAPYSAPLTLTHTTTVLAITVVPGQGSSPVAGALFLAPAPATLLAGLGGNGSGWTLNGGAVVTSNVLTLTDGLEPEARSAFFDTPQYIAAFQAQFIYQASGFADGAAFVLQNATNGANAVGSADSGLGYRGLSPSAAIELNICDCTGGTGTLLGTNGLVGYPTGYISTLPVNNRSGHPIWVRLNYDGSILAEDLVDLVTGATFNANYAVNLPAILGSSSTGFVGFTGSDGDGNLASVQTIGDFTFAPAPLLSAALAGNQITISWAASALNYVLQFTTNLAAPVTWAAVPQTPVVSGVQATVTVPIAATNTFFRLLAP